VNIRRHLYSLAQVRARAPWRMYPDFRRGDRYGRNFHDTAGTPSGSSGLPVNELEAYFDAHKTGRGLWKWRHYFPIYDAHFAKFKGREVHILEIGIFSGGSLDMWRSYFGDKVHVYGVDIEPACRVYESSGTRIFIGDQSDRKFWQQFIAEVPQLDIIIDDGGHLPSQQIPTLEMLLPHLRPGGVYLCEDIRGRFNTFVSYVHGLSRDLYGGQLFDENPDLELTPTDLQRSIDSIHLYPFVAVVEKREERLEHMSAPKHGTEWQPFTGVPLPE
jgi:hypothetical protein